MFSMKKDTYLPHSPDRFIGGHIMILTVNKEY